MIFQKFWSRHKRLIFVFFLFSLPLAPILFFRVRLPRLNIYERMNTALVLPFTEALRNAGSGVGVLWDRYLHLVNVSRDNDNLKKENDKLRGEILSLQEAQIESVRLKKLINLQDVPQSEQVVAKVVGQDTSFENLGFFINAGENQGLQPRMPVINAQGIVGTITRVFKNSASFVTILDPSHDVDALIVRSRARLVVEGKGKPLVARLKYLDRSEDVRVGDTVITSGLDGVFPKGLLVGSIVKVEKPQAGVLQEAELRAAFELGTLEEVIVIKNIDATAPALARRPETQAK